MEVFPAYTSIIGVLKYAPQLNIDKYIAGAYVIGRKALGFEGEIPENCLRLLSDKGYLDYVLHYYEEKEKELIQALSKETNRYKQRAIKSYLEEIRKEKPLLKSFQSEVRSCLAVNGRNSKQDKKLWQVLRGAFLFPVLGQILPRDLYPLKPILVEVPWSSVRSRLVPSRFLGTSSSWGIFETDSSDI